MTSSQSIKAGDEVRVLCRISRRSQSIPEGGYRAIVTKVARKYATAVFTERWTLGGQEQRREREISFDMETGQARADTEGLYVRTPEQLDRDERRKVALFHLDNAGVELKMWQRSHLTLEQIEALAEVVKTWDQEG
jgi:hypothetical protein